MASHRNAVRLFYAAVAFTTSMAEVVIQTGQGELEGTMRVASDGTTPYVAFYGIPFAQPPVGDLRFKPPVPASGWEGGRRDATRRNGAHECLQNDVNDPTIVDGDEDCLYLNVYTRHPGDELAKKDVIVWIHGGAFIFGGARPYGEDRIMEEDVVLVVIQYRLNIFGFLSNEDSDLPGNYGMHDQAEAIRWVHKYILPYGGDPNKVSILGMSAGGASVHYHMLSPVSKGLFNNAISLSGSSLNWWASIPNQKQQAEKLAAIVGCDESAPWSDCLRKVPAKELIDAHSQFFEWHPEDPAREPMNVFSPRSDPEADQPFLPKHPLKVMEDGEINDAPYMIGYAEKEGGWRINYIAPDGPKGKALWKEFKEKAEEILPMAIGIFGGNSEKPELLMERILREYQLTNLAAEEEPSVEEMSALVDLSGDTMFTYGIAVTAALHAQNGKAPTYFEHMRYPLKDSLTLFRTDGSLDRPPYDEDVLGKATHGTDMLLLFNMFPFEPMSPEDKDVSRRYIKMIVDFLKYGKSTLYPSWEPLTPENSCYLDMNTNFAVVEGPLPVTGKLQFWNTLPVYWNYTLRAGSRGRDEL